MFSSPVSRQRREGGPSLERISEVTSHTTSTTTTTTTFSSVPSPSRERDSSSPLGSFLFTQAFPLSLLRRSRVTPHNRLASRYTDQPESRGYRPINSREKDDDDGYVTTSSLHVSAVSPGGEATNDSSFPPQRIKGERILSSSLSSSSGCDRNACPSADHPVGSSQSCFHSDDTSGILEEPSPSHTSGGETERLTRELQEKTQDSGEDRGGLKQIEQHCADDLLVSRDTVTRVEKHEEKDSGHVGPSSHISHGIRNDGGLSFSIPGVQTPPAPTCIAIRGNLVAVGGSEGVIVLLSRSHPSLPLRPFARLQIPYEVLPTLERKKQISFDPSPSSFSSFFPSVSSLLLWSPDDESSSKNSSSHSSEEKEKKEMEEKKEGENVYLFVGTTCGRVWLYTKCLDRLLKGSRNLCASQVELSTDRRRRKWRGSSPLSSSCTHLKETTSSFSPSRSREKEDDCKHPKTQLSSSLHGVFSSSLQTNRHKSGTANRASNLHRSVEPPEDSLSSSSSRLPGCRGGEREAIEVGVLSEEFCPSYEAFISLFDTSLVGANHVAGRSSSRGGMSSHDDEPSENDAGEETGEKEESERRGRRGVEATSSFPVTALAVCRGPSNEKKQRRRRKERERCMGEFLEPNSNGRSCRNSSCCRSASMLRDSSSVHTHHPHRPYRLSRQVSLPRGDEEEDVLSYGEEAMTLAEEEEEASQDEERFSLYVFKGDAGGYLSRVLIEIKASSLSLSSSSSLASLDCQDPSLLPSQERKSDSYPSGDHSLTSSETLGEAQAFFRVQRLGGPEVLLGRQGEKKTLREEKENEDEDDSHSLEGSPTIVGAIASLSLSTATSDQMIEKSLGGRKPVQEMIGREEEKQKCQRGKSFSTSREETRTMYGHSLHSSTPPFSFDERRMGGVDLEYQGKEANASQILDAFFAEDEGVFENSKNERKRREESRQTCGDVFLVVSGYKRNLVIRGVCGVLDRVSVHPIGSKSHTGVYTAIPAPSLNLTKDEPTTSSSSSKDSSSRNRDLALKPFLHNPPNSSGSYVKSGVGEERERDENSSQVAIFASRPGGRVWIADFHTGKVQATLRLGSKGGGDSHKKRNHVCETKDELASSSFLHTKDNVERREISDRGRRESEGGVFSSSFSSSSLVPQEIHHRPLFRHIAHIDRSCFLGWNTAEDLHNSLMPPSSSSFSLGREPAVRVAARHRQKNLPLLSTNVKEPCLDDPEKSRHDGRFLEKNMREEKETHLKNQSDRFACNSGMTTSGTQENAHPTGSLEMIDTKESSCSSSPFSSSSQAACLLLDPSNSVSSTAVTCVSTTTGGVHTPGTSSSHSVSSSQSGLVLLKSSEQDFSLKHNRFSPPEHQQENAPLKEEDNEKTQEKETNRSTDLSSSSPPPPVTFIEESGMRHQRGPGDQGEREKSPCPTTSTLDHCSASMKFSRSSLLHPSTPPTGRGCGAGKATCISPSDHSSHFSVGMSRRVVLCDLHHIQVCCQWDLPCDIRQVAVDMKRKERRRAQAHPEGRSSPGEEHHSLTLSSSCIQQTLFLLQSPSLAKVCAREEEEEEERKRNEDERFLLGARTQIHIDGDALHQASTKPVSHSSSSHLSSSFSLPYEGYLTSSVVDGRTSPREREGSSFLSSSSLQPCMVTGSPRRERMNEEIFLLSSLCFFTDSKAFVSRLLQNLFLPDVAGRYTPHSEGEESLFWEREKVVRKIHSDHVYSVNHSAEEDGEETDLNETKKRRPKMIATASCSSSESVEDLPEASSFYRDRLATCSRRIDKREESDRLRLHCHSPLSPCRFSSSSSLPELPFRRENEIVYDTEKSSFLLNFCEGMNSLSWLHAVLEVCLSYALDEVSLHLDWDLSTSWLSRYLSRKPSSSSSYHMNFGMRRELHIEERPPSLHSEKSLRRRSLSHRKLLSILTACSNRHNFVLFSREEEEEKRRSEISTNHDEQEKERSVFLSNQSRQAQAFLNFLFPLIKLVLDLQRQSKDENGVKISWRSNGRCNTQQLPQPLEKEKTMQKTKDEGFSYCKGGEFTQQIPGGIRSDRTHHLLSLSRSMDTPSPASHCLSGSVHTPEDSCATDLLFSPSSSSSSSQSPSFLSCRPSLNSPPSGNILMMVTPHSMVEDLLIQRPEISLLLQRFSVLIEAVEALAYSSIGFMSLGPLRNFPSAITSSHNVYASKTIATEPQRKNTRISSSSSSSLPSSSLHLQKSSLSSSPSSSSVPQTSQKETSRRQTSSSSFVSPPNELPRDVSSSSTSFQARHRVTPPHLSPSLSLSSSTSQRAKPSTPIVSSSSSVSGLTTFSLLSLPPSSIDVIPTLCCSEVFLFQLPLTLSQIHKTVLRLKAWLLAHQAIWADPIFRCTYTSCLSFAAVFAAAASSSSSSPFMFSKNSLGQEERAREERSSSLNLSSVHSDLLKDDRSLRCPDYKAVLVSLGGSPNSSNTPFSSSRSRYDKVTSNDPNDRHGFGDESKVYTSSRRIPTTPPTASSTPSAGASAACLEVPLSFSSSEGAKHTMLSLNQKTSFSSSSSSSFLSLSSCHEKSSEKTSTASPTSSSTSLSSTSGVHTAATTTPDIEVPLDSHSLAATSSHRSRFSSPFSAQRWFNLNSSSSSSSLFLPIKETYTSTHRTSLSGGPDGRETGSQHDGKKKTSLPSTGGVLSEILLSTSDDLTTRSGNLIDSVMTAASHAASRAIFGGRKIREGGGEEERRGRKEQGKSRYFKKDHDSSDLWFSAADGIYVSPLTEESLLEECSVQGKRSVCMHEIFLSPSESISGTSSDFTGVREECEKSSLTTLEVSKINQTSRKKIGNEEGMYERMVSPSREDSQRRDKKKTNKKTSPFFSKKEDEEQEEGLTRGEKGFPPTLLPSKLASPSHLQHSRKDRYTPTSPLQSIPECSRRTTDEEEEISQKGRREEEEERMNHSHSSHGVISKSLCGEGTRLGREEDLEGMREKGEEEEKEVKGDSRREEERENKLITMTNEKKEERGGSRIMMSKTLQDSATAAACAAAEVAGAAAISAVSGAAAVAGAAYEKVFSQQQQASPPTPTTAGTTLPRLASLPSPLGEERSQGIQQLGSSLFKYFLRGSPSPVSSPSPSSSSSLSSTRVLTNDPCSAWGVVLAPPLPRSSRLPSQEGEAKNILKATLPLSSHDGVASSIHISSTAETCLNGLDHVSCSSSSSGSLKTSLQSSSCLRERVMSPSPPFPKSDEDERKKEEQRNEQRSYIREDLLIRAAEGGAKEGKGVAMKDEETQEVRFLVEDEDQNIKEIEKIDMNMREMIHELPPVPTSLLPIDSHPKSEKKSSQLWSSSLPSSSHSPVSSCVSRDSDSVLPLLSPPLHGPRSQREDRQMKESIDEKKFSKEDGPSGGVCTLEEVRDDRGGGAGEPRSLGDSSLKKKRINKRREGDLFPRGEIEPIRTEEKEEERGSRRIVGYQVKRNEAGLHCSSSSSRHDGERFGCPLSEGRVMMKSEEKSSSSFPISVPDSFFFVLASSVISSRRPGSTEDMITSEQIVSTAASLFELLCFLQTKRREQELREEEEEEDDEKETEKKNLHKMEGRKFSSITGRMAGGCGDSAKTQEKRRTRKVHFFLSSSSEQESSFSLSPGEQEEEEEDETPSSYIEEQLEEPLEERNPEKKREERIRRGRNDVLRYHVKEKKWVGSSTSPYLGIPFLLKGDTSPLDQQQEEKEEALDHLLHLHDFFSSSSLHHSKRRKEAVPLQSPSLGRYLMKEESRDHFLSPFSSTEEEEVSNVNDLKEEDDQRGMTSFITGAMKMWLSQDHQRQLTKQQEKSPSEVKKKRSRQAVYIHQHQGNRTQGIEEDAGPDKGGFLLSSSSSIREDTKENAGEEKTKKKEEAEKSGGAASHRPSKLQKKWKRIMKGEEVDDPSSSFLRTNMSLTFTERDALLFSICFFNPLLVKPHAPTSSASLSDSPLRLLSSSQRDIHKEDEESLQASLSPLLSAHDGLGRQRKKEKKTVILDRDNPMKILRLQESSERVLRAIDRVMIAANSMGWMKVCMCLSKWWSSPSSQEDHHSFFSHSDQKGEEQKKKKNEKERLQAQLYEQLQKRMQKTDDFVTHLDFQSSFYSSIHQKDRISFSCLPKRSPLSSSSSFMSSSSSSPLLSSGTSSFSCLEKHRHLAQAVKDIALGQLEGVKRYPHGGEIKRRCFRIEEEQEREHMKRGEEMLEEGRREEREIFSSSFLPHNSFHSPKGVPLSPLRSPHSSIQNHIERQEEEREEEKEEKMKKSYDKKEKQENHHTFSKKQSQVFMKHHSSLPSSIHRKAIRDDKNKICLTSSTSSIAKSIDTIATACVSAFPLVLPWNVSMWLIEAGRAVMYRLYRRQLEERTFFIERRGREKKKSDLRQIPYLSHLSKSFAKNRRSVTLGRDDMREDYSLRTPDGIWARVYWRDGSSEERIAREEEEREDSAERKRRKKERRYEEVAGEGVKRDGGDMRRRRKGKEARDEDGSKEEGEGDLLVEAEEENKRLKKKKKKENDDDDDDKDRREETTDVTRKDLVSLSECFEREVRDLSILHLTSSSSLSSSSPLFFSDFSPFLSTCSFSENSSFSACGPSPFISSSRPKSRTSVSSSSSSSSFLVFLPMVCIQIFRRYLALLRCSHRLPLLRPPGYEDLLTFQAQLHFLACASHSHRPTLLPLLFSRRKKEKSSVGHDRHLQHMVKRRYAATPHSHQEDVSSSSLSSSLEQGKKSSRRNMASRRKDDFSSKQGPASCRSRSLMTRSIESYPSDRSSCLFPLLSSHSFSRPSSSSSEREEEVEEEEPQEQQDGSISLRQQSQNLPSFNEKEEPDYPTILTPSGIFPLDIRQEKASSRPRLTPDGVSRNISGTADKNNDVKTVSRVSPEDSDEVSSWIEEEEEKESRRRRERRRIQMFCCRSVQAIVGLDAEIAGSSGRYIDGLVMDVLFSSLSKSSSFSSYRRKGSFSTLSPSASRFIGPLGFSSSSSAKASLDDVSSFDRGTREADKNNYDKGEEKGIREERVLWKEKDDFSFSVKTEKQLARCVCRLLKVALRLGSASHVCRLLSGVTVPLIRQLASKCDVDRRRTVSPPAQGMSQLEISAVERKEDEEERIRQGGEDEPRRSSSLEESSRKEGKQEVQGGIEKSGDLKQQVQGSPSVNQDLKYGRMTRHRSLSKKDSERLSLLLTACVAFLAEALAQTTSGWTTYVSTSPPPTDSHNCPSVRLKRDEDREKNEEENNSLGLLEMEEELQRPPQSVVSLERSPGRVEIEASPAERKSYDIQEDLCGEGHHLHWSQISQKVAVGGVCTPHRVARTLTPSTSSRWWKGKRGGLLAAREVLFCLLDLQQCLDMLKRWGECGVDTTLASRHMSSDRHGICEECQASEVFSIISIAAYHPQIVHFFLARKKAEEEFIQREGRSKEEGKGSFLAGDGEVLETEAEKNPVLLSSEITSPLPSYDTSAGTSNSRISVEKQSLDEKNREKNCSQECLSDRGVKASQSPSSSLHSEAVMILEEDKERMQRRTGKKRGEEQVSDAGESPSSLQRARELDPFSSSLSSTSKSGLLHPSRNTSSEPPTEEKKGRREEKEWTNDSSACNSIGSCPSQKRFTPSSSFMMGEGSDNVMVDVGHPAAVSVSSIHHPASLDTHSSSVRSSHEEEEEEEVKEERELRNNKEEEDRRQALRLHGDGLRTLPMQQFDEEEQKGEEENKKERREERDLRDKLSKGDHHDWNEGEKIHDFMTVPGKTRRKDRNLFLRFEELPPSSTRHAVISVVFEALLLWRKEQNTHSSRCHQSQKIHQEERDLHEEAQEIEEEDSDSKDRRRGESIRRLDVEEVEADHNSTHNITSSSSSTRQLLPGRLPSSSSSLFSISHGKLNRKEAKKNFSHKRKMNKDMNSIKYEREESWGCIRKEESEEGKKKASTDMRALQHLHHILSRKDDVISSLRSAVYTPHVIDMKAFDQHVISMMNSFHSPFPTSSLLYFSPLVFALLSMHIELLSRSISILKSVEMDHLSCSRDSSIADHSHLFSIFFSMNRSDLNEKLKSTGQRDFLTERGSVAERSRELELKKRKKQMLKKKKSSLSTVLPLGHSVSSHIHVVKEMKTMKIEEEEEGPDMIEREKKVISQDAGESVGGEGYSSSSIPTTEEGGEEEREEEDGEEEEESVLSPSSNVMDDLEFYRQYSILGIVKRLLYLSSHEKGGREVLSYHTSGLIGTDDPPPPLPSTPSSPAFFLPTQRQRGSGVVDREEEERVLIRRKMDWPAELWKEVSALVLSAKGREEQHLIICPSFPHLLSREGQGLSTEDWHVSLLHNGDLLNHEEEEGHEEDSFLSSSSDGLFLPSSSSFCSSIKKTSHMKERKGFFPQGNFGEKSVVTYQKRRTLESPTFVSFKDGRAEPLKARELPTGKGWRGSTTTATTTGFELDLPLRLPSSSLFLSSSSSVRLSEGRCSSLSLSGSRGGVNFERKITPTTSAITPSGAALHQREEEEEYGQKSLSISFLGRRRRKELHHLSPSPKKAYDGLSLDPTPLHSRRRCGPLHARSSTPFSSPHSPCDDFDLSRSAKTKTQNTPPLLGLSTASSSSSSTSTTRASSLGGSAAAALAALEETLMKKWNRSLFPARMIEEEEEDDEGVEGEVDEKKVVPKEEVRKKKMTVGKEDEDRGGGREEEEIDREVGRHPHHHKKKKDLTRERRLERFQQRRDIGESPSSLSSYHLDSPAWRAERIIAKIGSEACSNDNNDEKKNVGRESIEEDREEETDQSVVVSSATHVFSSESSQEGVETEEGGEDEEEYKEELKTDKKKTTTEEESDDGFFAMKDSVGGDDRRHPLRESSLSGTRCYREERTGVSFLPGNLLPRDQEVSEKDQKKEIFSPSSSASSTSHSRGLVQVQKDNEEEEEERKKTDVQIGVEREETCARKMETFQVRHEEEEGKKQESSPPCVKRLLFFEDENEEDQEASSSSPPMLRERTDFREQSTWKTLPSAPSTEDLTPSCGVHTPEKAAARDPLHSGGEENEESGKMSHGVMERIEEKEPDGGISNEAGKHMGDSNRKNVFDFLATSSSRTRAHLFSDSSDEDRKSSSRSSTHNNDKGAEASHNDRRSYENLNVEERKKDFFGQIQVSKPTSSEKDQDEMMKKNRLNEGEGSVLFPRFSSPLSSKKDEGGWTVRTPEVGTTRVEAGLCYKMDLLKGSRGGEKSLEKFNSFSSTRCKGKDVYEDSLQGRDSVPERNTMKNNKKGALIRVGMFHPLGEAYQDMTAREVPEEEEKQFGLHRMEERKVRNEEKASTGKRTASSGSVKTEDEKTSKGLGDVLLLLPHHHHHQDRGGVHTLEREKTSNGAETLFVQTSACPSSSSCDQRDETSLLSTSLPLHHRHFEQSKGIRPRDGFFQDGFLDKVSSRPLISSRKKDLWSDEDGPANQKSLEASPFPRMSQKPLSVREPTFIFPSEKKEKEEEDGRNRRAKKDLLSSPCKPTATTTISTRTPLFHPLLGNGTSHAPEETHRGRRRHVDQRDQIASTDEERNAYALHLQQDNRTSTAHDKSYNDLQKNKKEEEKEKAYLFSTDSSNSSHTSSIFSPSLNDLIDQEPHEQRHGRGRRKEENEKEENLQVRRSYREDLQEGCPLEKQP